VAAAGGTSGGGDIEGSNEGVPQRLGRSSELWSGTGAVIFGHVDADTCRQFGSRVGGGGGRGRRRREGDDSTV
jgi:hypothetical protein